MSDVKKVSWGEKIAFALGDGGCNFVWTTIGSFLTLYYTDNVGIAAAVIGTIMLLSRLVDGISDLAMGTVIDHTHTKIGRARPWIIWSAPFMALGLIACFAVPNSLSSGGKIAYAAISYTVMAAIVYTASNLSYNSLLSLATDNPKDRVQMSSLRFFCTMATVLFINYNAMKFQVKFGWVGMAVIFGLIGFVLLMVTGIFVKEHNNRELNGKIAAKQTVANSEIKARKVKESWKALFQNKYFIFTTLIFVVNYTALGVNNGLRIYYARNVLGNVGLMGTLTLCFILPKMIGNLLFPPIAKALGKWKSMMIGYALEIIGLLIMVFTPTSFSTAVVGLVCLGIGGIPHNAGLFAMVGDVVDYGEWKTGIRIDGLTNSAASFGMKVGAGLGSALEGWGLAWAHYDGALGAAQSASTNAGIKVIFTVVPIVLFAIGMVCLAFCNLDKKLPEIHKELEERKAKV